MPRYERYTRTRISTEPYVDLGGREAVRPGAGRLPTEELFPDRIVYNLDGTVTEEVPENALISRVPICDICLRPVESVEEDLVERDNHWLCKDCIDEGPPLYPPMGSRPPATAPPPVEPVYGYYSRRPGVDYNRGDGRLWPRSGGV